MELNFTKMQCNRNDFVILDCRAFDIAEYFNLNSLAVRLCDRRSGIGADQLLLLYNSLDADFRLKIFNSGGKEVGMCGNGIICLAKYIWNKEISDKGLLKIDTLAALVNVERIGDMVRVDMGEPVFDADKIPVNLKLKRPIIDYPIHAGNTDFRVTCLALGGPQAVVFLKDDLAEFLLSAYGPAIENHPLFPEKTDISFVNVKSKQELMMRFWEKGVGETMACSTGAAAAGVAAILKGLTGRKVTVSFSGGEVAIEWPHNDHVYITSPAVEVFEGKIMHLEEKRRECRRHQRKVCKATLGFSKKGEPRCAVYSCICIDISESGVAIITDQELKMGDVVVFKKKESTLPLRTAVVMWSTVADNKYKAGLMFI